MMSMTYTTLISASQLQSLMASGQPLMVFDCSFDLGDPALARASTRKPISAAHGTPTWITT